MPQAKSCIQQTQDAVLFWSDTRLPFEPKADVLASRDALRAELRALPHQDGMFLTALYVSQDRGFFDVENVLFYNVGAAAFTGLARRGLTFDRQRGAPPLAPDGRQYQHHHCYTLVQAPPPPPPAPLCVLEFPVGTLSSSTKPHEVWWRASSVRPEHWESHQGGPISVHLTLAGVDVRNAAAILKPLLDGVVSALHCSETTDATTLERIAARTGWDPDAIAQRLRSPPAPVLGKRRGLVARYRDFVKWNPADELCERCTLVVEPAGPGTCRVEVGQLPNAD